MSLRLEDYALIGDCETAALVAFDRIDRLARLAAVRFRGLLRVAARHARTWPLAARASRLDSVTVIDFMPPRGRNSDIVRLVRGIEGRVRMCMVQGVDLKTVPDFEVTKGATVPFVLTHGSSYSSLPRRSIRKHRFAAPRSSGKTGPRELSRRVSGPTP